MTDGAKLEAAGWRQIGQMWLLPSSTMHVPVSTATAVAIQKIIERWDDDEDTKS